MKKYFKNFLILFLLGINGSFGSDELENRISITMVDFKLLKEKNKHSEKRKLKEKLDLENLIELYEDTLRWIDELAIETIYKDIKIKKTTHYLIKEIITNRDNKKEKEKEEYLKNAIKKFYICFNIDKKIFYLASDLVSSRYNDNNNCSTDFTKVDDLENIFKKSDIFNQCNKLNLADKSYRDDQFNLNEKKREELTGMAINLLEKKITKRVEEKNFLYNIKSEIQDKIEEKKRQ